MLRSSLDELSCVIISRGATAGITSDVKEVVVEHCKTSSSSSPAMGLVMGSWLQVIGLK